MGKTNKCHYCGYEFNQRISEHKFCKRQCKEAYRRKGRGKLPDEEKAIRQELKAKYERKYFKPNRIKNKYQMSLYYKKKFNLTLKQVEELRKNHSGVCDICGTNKPGGGFGIFHIDHIKGTKIIRGLLCNNCNVGIGWLKHDINILQRAIEYLSRFTTEV